MRATTSTGAPPASSPRSSSTRARWRSRSSTPRAEGSPSASTRAALRRLGRSELALRSRQLLLRLLEVLAVSRAGGAPRLLRRLGHGAPGLLRPGLCLRQRGVCLIAVGVPQREHDAGRYHRGAATGGADGEAV